MLHRNPIPIICNICGNKYKNLSKHLIAAHQLTRLEYINAHAPELKQQPWGNESDEVIADRLGISWGTATGIREALGIKKMGRGRPRKVRFKQLLEYLMAHHTIYAKAYAHLTGVIPGTARDDLEYFVEQGFLEKDASSRTYEYRLTENLDDMDDYLRRVDTVNRRRNPDASDRKKDRMLYATGDPEAKAAVLASKVRRGIISRRDVELAAFFGSEIALMVAEPTDMVAMVENIDEDRLEELDPRSIDMYDGLTNITRQPAFAALGVELTFRDFLAPAIITGALDEHILPISRMILDYAYHYLTQTVDSFSSAYDTAETHQIIYEKDNSRSWLIGLVKHITRLLGMVVGSRRRSIDKHTQERLEMALRRDVIAYLLS